MMRLIALLFFMFVGSAWAQTPCYPMGIKGKSISGPVIKRNANGYYAYWYCDVGNQILGYYRCIESGRYERYVTQAIPEFLAAYAQTDSEKRRAAIEAFDAKYTNASPAPENEAVCANALDEVRSNAPAHPSFVVAKNGTSLTRPTYLFANGVRGAIASERVEVGTACNAIDAYVQSGSSTYAAVLSRKDRVALCQRVSN